MAGSLVLVDTFTVSSSVASVIIGGGSSGSSSLNYAMDDTFDVYKLVITNLRPSADDAPMMRVTKSGSPDNTAAYDIAHRYLKADTSHTTYGAADGNKFDCMTTIDAASTASGNGIYYLFNFPSSSYNTSQASGYKFALPNMMNQNLSIANPYIDENYFSQQVGNYSLFSDLSQKNNFLSGSDRNKSIIGEKFKSSTCGLIFGESNILGTDSIAFGGLKK